LMATTLGVSDAWCHSGQSTTPPNLPECQRMSSPAPFPNSQHLLIWVNTAPSHDEFPIELGHCRAIGSTRRVSRYLLIPHTPRSHAANQILLSLSATRQRPARFESVWTSSPNGLHLPQLGSFVRYGRSTASSLEACQSVNVL
jgi:hypothetical protein